MKKRRSIEVFSLSFLDVICCGFGAIILLLVLSLALEPATLEHMKSDMSGEIKQIEDELREYSTGEPSAPAGNHAKKQSSTGVPAGCWRS